MVKKISTDIYELISMTNISKRVEVLGGFSDDGRQIQIYQSNNGSCQRFKIERLSDGTGAYKILTGNTNYSKCLTVQNASTANSAWIIQFGYGYDGASDNDHWYFQKYNP